MWWTLLRIVIALGGALVVYLVAAGMIRNFAQAEPPPEEPDPETLADVDFRYGCVVCGAQLVLYAAPEGEPPEPPRHCREPMALIVPIDDHASRDRGH